METYFPGHTLEMLEVLFQALDQQFLLQGWKIPLYMVKLRCCVFSPQDGTEQSFLYIFIIIIHRSYKAYILTYFSSQLTR